ncbi:alcohol dehydrogenase [Sistotremastrum niveocremeum HHB9708]|uniref:Alcohol dehydrogenase n=1 Tax=Sistotremastrum niveocremeum HHB9708 TaxID=1314777 RepID=A0A165A021_9AGAM|nr:alcohol dehydrogenase [Sistotremastrum niveocremeum HHB9708]
MPPGPFVMGHEFVGEVVALGSSYGLKETGNRRSELYSTLKVGDKVVSPFTTSCGECHFCRIGFTSRCVHSLLFGHTRLPGGQAQYVRVPHGGGTLFKIPPDHTTEEVDADRWLRLADESLILLADILPTGCFAALQALQHANLLPILRSRPYPWSSGLFSDDPSTDLLATTHSRLPLAYEDNVLTFAVVGLGPVGLCALVALIHLLEQRNVEYRIAAIDLNRGRQLKAAKIIEKIGLKSGVAEAGSIEEGTALVKQWTSHVGCNAVLEVVGHNSAVRLAYELIRPFGVISSVGVHQNVQVPLNGEELYDKNVSLAFGRCPVRAMFPIALDVLLHRQDVFAGVGQDVSLVEQVVGMDDATAQQAYVQFDTGASGKILFDPWL